jgi:putative endonuclease
LLPHAAWTHEPQRIVYILKNTETPPRYYMGLTSNLAKRLDDHNSGRCSHTSKFLPWSVDVMLKFSDERRAVAFERYLKSGSGFEFAKRHLR